MHIPIGTSTHPGVTPLGRCSDKGKGLYSTVAVIFVILCCMSHLGRQSMRKSTLAPLSHSGRLLDVTNFSYYVHIKSVI